MVHKNRLRTVVARPKSVFMGPWVYVSISLPDPLSDKILMSLTFIPRRLKFRPGNPEIEISSTKSTKSHLRGTEPRPGGFQPHEGGRQ